ncbi:Probable chlorophyll(ide) b reductase NYC1, chloroplastic [Linum grandiflorum]
MAAVAIAKFQVYPADISTCGGRQRTASSRFFFRPPPPLGFFKGSCGLSSSSSQQCRAFRSEDGERKGEDVEKENETKSFDKEDGLWAPGIGRFKLLSKEEYTSGVARVEELFSSVAIHIGRYIVTMMSTGVVLATGFQLSGGDGQMNDLIWYSWLGGIIIGTMTGANMVLDEHCRAGPRNVVITGSTRGLGKALAREFLLSGDHVVVASRSQESVDMTVKELEENLKEGMASAAGSSKQHLGHSRVVGIACDVCDPSDVKKLADFAVKEFGSINLWINNAGTNKGFRPLLQFSDEDITQIVSTNLVGSILCTREAMRVMENQPKGGHIFNMDGAGSGGSSTPLTAVYGATKCGLRQLQTSLLKESKKSKVGVHTASPGMVLTELLLSSIMIIISGSTLKNKQMFNIICELPETVARTLVPRMRVVKGSGKAINYLTPPRILLALVTAWLRRGRWFDDKVICDDHYQFLNCHQVGTNSGNQM